MIQSRKIVIVTIQIKHVRFHFLQQFFIIKFLKYQCFYQKPKYLPLAIYPTFWKVALVNHGLGTHSHLGLFLKSLKIVKCDNEIIVHAKVKLYDKKTSLIIICLEFE
jgi:hypothetical protein